MEGVGVTRCRHVLRRTLRVTQDQAAGGGLDAAAPPAHRQPEIPERRGVGKAVAEGDVRDSAVAVQQGEHSEALNGAAALRRARPARDFRYRVPGQHDREIDVVRREVDRRATAALRRIEHPGVAPAVATRGGAAMKRTAISCGGL
jgi:hypothetical protein